MPKVKLKNGNLAASREALRGCLGRSAESRYGLRIACLLRAAAGFGRAQVGRRYGKSGRNVERWAKDFQRLGIAGLRDGQRSGRAGGFGAEELTRLREDLAQPPEAFGLEAGEWTGGLLAGHVRRRCGHDLSGRQAQRLWSRLRAEAVAGAGGDATFISGKKARNESGPRPRRQKCKKS